MNERLRELRKALGFKNQQEFADALNIKRGTIANYEIGRNEPIDAVITLICSKFNVNEEWLRTGEGEMFIELTRKDKIMAWATEALSGQSDDYRNRFVDVLDALSVDDWEVLANMAETMANRNKKKKD
jgi:transcriptional regulator with XRE-family HTH domain